MAIEIERKYLVINDHWRIHAERSAYFRQGYLAAPGKASVRVRLEDNAAFLNIKSATLGIKRTEFEYEIPVADANQMLNELCATPLVEKVRYWVTVEGTMWEIDVFEGDNAGLIVAEVELSTEDETFVLPDWAGKEVSDDARYYNVNLVQHPYRTWESKS